MKLNRKEIVDGKEARINFKIGAWGTCLLKDFKYSKIQKGNEIMARINKSKGKGS
jgi:hypothetical protein